MSALTWEEWLAEHIKTCSTCDAAFNAMDGGMCETAFAQLQASLKQKTQDGDGSVDG